MSTVKTSDLAKVPPRLAAPTEEYDFNRQVRVSGLTENALAVTYAGTQTHNNQGRAVDKDND